MPEYLVYGANSNTDFRKEELESLANLENIKVDLSSHDQTSPFFTITLPNDEQAQRLVSRSILLRGIYLLLAHGTSYESLNVNLKADSRYPFKEYSTASFKFTFEVFDAGKLSRSQSAIMDSLAHLQWTGKIDLANGENEFSIIEDWSPPKSHHDPTQLQHDHHQTAQMNRVWFGRLVGRGARGLVRRYDLKKRGYLGTTSMDAELSLVSANQVLASRSKLIYDPFVGTGSFLLTASAFGAVTLGSDIDGRQIKGKKGLDIRTNFKDYQLVDLLLDCLVFDVKHAPWHTNFKVDGVIADPPYGVRAGAKTLGRAEGTKLFGRTEPAQTPDGDFVHMRENYVPPKRAYELSDLADDLLDFASQVLVPGGRLVFWLPTVNEDYSVVDLPARSDMSLLANSTQNFGRWSRRLLTYERLDVADGERKERVRTAGHTDFRYKYHTRFGEGKTIEGDKYDRLPEKAKEYFTRA